MSLCRFALRLVVVSAAAFAAPALSAHAQPRATEDAEPSLDAVRQAAERFRDVNVALAEGYLRDPLDLCETADMMGRPAELGAMGIHFFRPDLLGLTADAPRVDGVGTHTDFLNPAILLYEPQADGSLELVGVENLVFKSAWHAAGHAEPPAFHGVVWDDMEDDPATEVDEAHLFMPHYDRHVWVFRENPSGVFSPFNPAVTCAHHRPTTNHSHGAGGH